MSTYVDVVKQAFLFFPVIALLFTLPYIVYNYHKYGSILSLRILIVYSFILYLICVYFLVILPLPSREDVAAMQARGMQLIPFHFLRDILKESKFQASNPGTWITLIINPALFQVLFNILMTLPFGIYLRYYFGCSLRKTIKYTFLLSLFFELTQLSGLYFYYPKNYRLFDVDDLMANTLGGALGFFCVQPFLKFLPSREHLDSESIHRSQEVSLLRRFTAMMLDLFFASVWTGILEIFLNISGFHQFSASLLFVLYFLVFPIFRHGQTPGKRITRLRIADSRSAVQNPESKDPSWYQYCIRSGSFVLLLFVLPFHAATLLYGPFAATALGILGFFFQGWTLTAIGTLLLSAVLAGLWFLFLLFLLIQAAMHKPLFYEKWSHTQVVSTIPV